MSRVRLLASGVAPDVLARLAPPACATAGLLSEWEPDGQRGLRLVLPLAPAFLADADRLIPSLSNTATADYSFQFGLRARVNGAATPWSRLTRIGRAPGDAAPAPRPAPDAATPIDTDVDTFRLRAPLAGAELEVRVGTADPVAFRRAPCLLAVSAAGPPTAPPAPAAATLADVPPVPVPAMSQMVEAGAVRHRICSPTSVAMVLGSLGIPATAMDVAAAAYCAEHDRYGVWPAGVWAASRRGALGYVAALDSWDCARELLARGIPLVVSEAHGPGGLPGSPLTETDGHLLVLRGLRAGRALVNDPAAAAAETVPMEYDLEEFGRAWLGHGGIAYVLVTPQGRP
jgi:hypothetical protein